MSKTLVDTLLELDRQALRWQVEVEPETAFRFFARAEEYNSMKEMSTLIFDIDKIIPLTQFPETNGWPNPNNGKQNHKYKVGNECSRVLYVEINPFYFKGEKRSLEEIAAQIEAVGQNHGADEVSSEITSGEGWKHLSVRLWWD